MIDLSRVQKYVSKHAKKHTLLQGNFKVPKNMELLGDLALAALNRRLWLLWPAKVLARPNSGRPEL